MVGFITLQGCGMSEQCYVMRVFNILLAKLNFNFFCIFSPLNGLMTEYNKDNEGVKKH